MGYILRAEKLLPFASLEKSYVKLENSPEGSEDVALSFILRSQFFNVSEWLNSKDNPEMQMGPATLRLVRDIGPSVRRPRHATAARVKSRPPPRRMAAAAAAGASPHGQVLIKDLKSAQTMAVWNLARKAFEWKGVRFALKHHYRFAVVTENKLVEGSEQPSPNPALELEVTAGPRTMREVLFAKFPNFSLNKDGVFGYSLEFKPGGGDAEETAQTSAEESGSGAGRAHTTLAHAAEGNEESPVGAGAGARPGAMGAGAHIIEFHVDPKNPKSARIELIKNGENVGSTVLSEGQSYQTPWMGMQVFLATLAWGSAPAVDARSVTPLPGMDLPPSAIYVHPLGGGDGFWLGEGDSKPIRMAGRNAEVTFGREILRTPVYRQVAKVCQTRLPGDGNPAKF